MKCLNTKCCYSKLDRIRGWPTSPQPDSLPKPFVVELPHACSQSSTYESRHFVWQEISGKHCLRYLVVQLCHKSTMRISCDRSISIFTLLTSIFVRPLSFETKSNTVRKRSNRMTAKLYSLLCQLSPV